MKYDFDKSAAFWSSTVLLLCEDCSWMIFTWCLGRFRSSFSRPIPLSSPFSEDPTLIERELDLPPFPDLLDKAEFWFDSRLALRKSLSALTRACDFGLVGAFCRLDALEPV